MQGLAMLVQQVLSEDPFNGALYAFRGRRGKSSGPMCWPKRCERPTVTTTPTKGKREPMTAYRRGLAYGMVLCVS